MFEFGARRASSMCLGPDASAVKNSIVDVGLPAFAGEFDLGLFSRLSQALSRHATSLLTTLDLVLFELGDHPLRCVGQRGNRHDACRPRWTPTSTTPSPTSGWKYREGAAAPVVHGDSFVLLLVQAIRERCSGRFVNDALAAKWPISPP